MKIRIKEHSIFPELTLYEYKFNKLEWIDCSLTENALFPIIKHLDILEVVEQPKGKEVTQKLPVEVTIKEETVSLEQDLPIPTEKKPRKKKEISNE